MAKRALADNLAAGIDQAGLVRLACPVDAGEPLGIVGHRSLFSSQPGHRDARHSLCWRSGRDSPRDVRRGQPDEARAPQVLETQGAMGGSRQAGPVPPRQSTIQTGLWTR
jgi:hypothetical protein